MAIHFDYRLLDENVTLPRYAICDKALITPQYLHVLELVRKFLVE